MIIHKTTNFIMKKIEFYFVPLAAFVTNENVTKTETDRVRESCENYF